MKLSLIEDGQDLFLGYFHDAHSLPPLWHFADLLEHGVDVLHRIPEVGLHEGLLHLDLTQAKVNVSQG